MQNLLRTYRKKSELSIENVSELLGLPDSSTLSRYERGERKPRSEIIFTYHILFQVSVEKLFEKEMNDTFLKIAKNIDPLINSLKQLESTKKNKARIVFLNSLKELIENKI